MEQAAASNVLSRQCVVHVQVRGVLDAMPSTNLKPENEEEELEADMVYRTTYMFSATMPPTVERLARKYLRRPVVVNIGSAGKATDNVAQVCFLIILVVILTWLLCSAAPGLTSSGTAISCFGACQKISRVGITFGYPFWMEQKVQES